MTLAGLALRNAFLRNKTRALLTVLGTVVAALAFVFLRSVLTAWYASSEASAADRVVTRNAVSIIQPLPLSYRDRIAGVPGVTQVSFSNWFGGIYKDRKNFFAQFAVDAQSALDVFAMRFFQGSKEEFLGDRNSCIIGRGLVERFGFKVGDTIPLFSEIYPGDWRFKVAGIIESPDDEASVRNTMFFHWARLNEGRRPGLKDTVGIFTSKIAKAADSPRVVREIDALFANSDNETHTETEKAFRLNFVTGSGAILSALEVVSGVILVIMALVLGNTLAMGLRERTSELGAMRAIGFLPKHVRRLAVAEGAMLGLIGGGLGVLLSPGALSFFRKGMAQSGFGFPLFLNTGIATAALVSAILIGALASAAPAWRAGQMSVVDALRRQE
ncbi:MAG: FtsX-like permease family protein [Deltaproteobacteria bacterium]|nr:MAG: FtsX-like permease family protein [Deltaproteobacteria bacterium]